MSLEPEIWPVADRFDRYVTLEFLEILERLYHDQLDDTARARLLHEESGEKWKEYYEEFKDVTGKETVMSSGYESPH